MIPNGHKPPSTSMIYWFFYRFIQMSLARLNMFRFPFQPFNTNVVHGNQSCIRHCMQRRHIKPICKCHWWPVCRHMQLNIRAIQAISIMDHRFIIHSHCHSRQSFIRAITIIICPIIIIITIIHTFCHRRRGWTTNCLHLICQTVISTRIHRTCMHRMLPHQFQSYRRVWPIQQLHYHRQHSHTAISANIRHSTIRHRRRRTPSRAMPAPLNRRTIVLTVHHLSLTMSPVQYRSAAIAITIFARPAPTKTIITTTTITTFHRQTITTTTSSLHPQRMAANIWMVQIQRKRRTVCSIFWWIRTSVRNSFTITIQCYFHRLPCRAPPLTYVCRRGRCCKRQRHVCCSWPCAGYDVWCHSKHYRKTINSFCFRFVSISLANNVNRRQSRYSNYEKIQFWFNLFLHIARFQPLSLLTSPYSPHRKTVNWY